MSQIECRQLRKSFGPVVALHDATLVAEAGEVCALLGPSGSGKTTLLRIIAGFEQPDSGSVEIAGRTVSARDVQLAPDKRRVGMVFQDYALFPHLDIAANVGFGLAGTEPERVREVLAMVGLEQQAGRYPHELSGGQQQRVAVARALAPAPDIVLLDEPFSNLDAVLRAQIRQDTRRILDETGVTAVFVTHDQEEALSFADSVAVISDGRVLQQGTPEQIYERPSSRWVAEFVGEANVLSGTARASSVSCELAELNLRPGFEGPADVIMRPESIAIAGTPPPPGHRAHRGVVVDREFYGHDQLVRVELESGLTLTSRRFGYPSWHPGDHVKVWLEGPATVLPATGAEPVVERASGGPAMADVRDFR